MPRPLAHSIVGVVALLLVGLCVGAGAAAGAKQSGVPYRGMTDQDREIKLIVDGRGRVKRGAFSAVTQCGGRFKPFTGDFTFRAPLDRSRPGKFRDEGTSLDSDGTYSGRYKWNIKGERQGKRKIDGKFSVEIVFRKDGRKYTTCKAEDVAYSAKLDDPGD
ncbi:MAG: hypothetical protein U0R51_04585 [Solirubrobacterales bacterium]